MRKIVKRVLLVVALAVLTAFSVAAVNVQAYPKPMGVTSSNTVDGHVLVRWNDDGAPIHRVGWTQETDLRAAQAAGDWLEAFHFADTTRPSNYTVKYLPHGQLYWLGHRFTGWVGHRKPTCERPKQLETGWRHSISLTRRDPRTTR